MNTTKEIKTVTIKPSQADEVGRALWRIEEARMRLHECLENLDEAILDWKPDDGANSIGSLLYHIALIEMDWLFVEVLERPFPPHLVKLFPWNCRDENGRLAHVSNVTLENHLERLATVRQTLLDTFSQMTLEDFRRLRSFEPYDVTPEWVLFHLTQHETEHRGQIQETIRLNGAR